MIALILFLAFRGASGLPADAAKPPWLWTSDERIALRVDPTARHARLLRELSSVRALAPGWSPINGSVEPELFLPEELVAELMRETDLQNVHGVDRRAYYRTAIQRAGWDVDSFWQAIDSAGATYLSLLKASAAAQRGARGHADVSQSQDMMCAVQAKMLSIVREKLGSERFDQFLYTSVAPSIVLWVKDEAESAGALKRAAEGCQ